MQEIILNIILLSVYTLVAYTKCQTTPIPYIKLAGTVLIPALLIVAVHFSFMFFPTDILIAVWDVLSYAMICVINLIACCYIYKIMTGNSEKLILIWQRNFKKWNILSLIMIIIGTFVAAIGQKYATTAMDFLFIRLFKDSILSFLTFADITLLFLKYLALAKLIFRAASVVFVMIPLFTLKNKSEAM